MNVPNASLENQGPLSVIKTSGTPWWAKCELTGGAPQLVDFNKPRVVVHYY